MSTTPINYLSASLGASIKSCSSATPYTKPAQKFRQIHYDLMDVIRKKVKSYIFFNNAMIEIYDLNYCKMGYHTDQSLDLEEDSYICLFSAYNVPHTKYLRKLQIKNKTTSECSEILLEHNSIVLFSTNTNREHLHKIVFESYEVKLDDKKLDKMSNKWLGLTFRLSKTLIKYVDESFLFHPSNEVLHLATEQEKKEFIRYKGRENSEIEYTYPKISYTVSPSDLMQVITNT